jgi:malonate transporter and related proteins
MHLVILGALAPIFIVIGLGFFAGRRGIIDNRHVPGLNALVMTFALPASIFVAIATTARRDMLQEGQLFLLLGVVMLAFFVIWYFVERRLSNVSSAEAAVQALVVAFPNCAAGLPIVAAVLGAAGDVHVAVALAAGSILVVPPTIFLLELSRMKKRSDAAATKPNLVLVLWRALTKPLVLASIVGAFISLSGVELSAFVTGPLDLIGQAAGGGAAFLTGLVLSALPFVLTRQVCIATIATNVVQPLAVFAFAKLLGAPPEIVKPAILIAALPAGFFGILFGVSYQANSKETGSTVIASTILSALTLIGIIAWLYPT